MEQKKKLHASMTPESLPVDALANVCLHISLMDYLNFEQHAKSMHRSLIDDGLSTMLIAKLIARDTIPISLSAIDALVARGLCL